MPPDRLDRDDVAHALDALASEVPAPTADAASLIARGRRRVFRQRVLVIGIAAAVIATAAGIGAVANRDHATRVVAVPTTPTTVRSAHREPTATVPAPIGGGYVLPASLAFASATEGWICNDPFVYTTDAFETVAKNVDIPTAATTVTPDFPVKLCAAAPGGNAWLLRGSGDPDRPEIVRIRAGGSNVQVFPFARIGQAKVVVSMTFVDADNGWALVAPESVRPGDSRDLYRTQDGGATWSLLARDLLISGSLAFATPDRGWAAAGAGATLDATTDGGRTWREVTVPSPAPHHGLPLSIRGVKVRGDVIVAFGGQTTHFVLTPFFDVSTDGGRTWRQRPGTRAFPGAWANSFDAADAEHWAISWSNYLYITDDGGKTWNERAQFSGVYQVHDIAFLDPKVMIVSGSGDKLSHSAVVLKTSDGGDHWSAVDEQSPIGPPGDVASFPGGIVGCPTRPLTPAESGNPPPGLVAAAIENIRTQRHYDPIVDRVYRVGGSQGGSFASVFTYNVGSCGKRVVDNSWVVELHGPIGQGGGGSTAQAQVVLAHYADGWHVFGRYH